MTKRVGVTKRVREALRKAFEWYGKPIVLSDEDRARIDRELFGESPKTRAKQVP